jgi:hypothetical protein
VIFAGTHPMAQSLAQAADDLTALAWRMHQLAEAELNELRTQLDQERQARQEAVERAESLERELALLKEQNEQECLRLSGELDQERQARQKAEGEVASIHAAILEQIAISEAEEAITKAAEQERAQRLQEQIQGLHNQLELEIRSRTQIETKLKGIRQAFYDLMLPIEPEESCQQNGFSDRLLQLDVKN